MGLSTRDISAFTPTQPWEAGGLHLAGQGTVTALLLQEDPTLL